MLTREDFHCSLFTTYKTVAWNNEVLFWPLLMMHVDVVTPYSTSASVYTVTCNTV